LLTGNLLSNDSDPDAGDSLTVTRFVVDGVTVDVPAGAVGGSTLIAGVGTLTVKADGSYSFNPLTNWNGNVPTVSYSIRDSAGATASSSLSITVGGGKRSADGERRQLRHHRHRRPSRRDADQRQCAGQ
jgi:hypothetical protein